MIRSRLLSCLPQFGRGHRGVLRDAVAGIALLCALGSDVHANLRIGFVEQETVCLPGISAVAYALDAGMPERGQIYAFHPPELVHRLGVFPADIVFVKRAAGLPGDRIEVSLDEGISVNGAVVTRGLPLAARLGTPIPDLERTFIVPEAHVFFLGETEDSLDGRYFGAVEISTHGIGRGWALW
ncbi:MAG: S26 family signal peptidase [Pseudomonadota bacterium]